MSADFPPCIWCGADDMDTNASFNGKDICNDCEDKSSPAFVCPACKTLKPFVAGSGDCQTCETCCKCPADAYATKAYCMPY